MKVVVAAVRDTLILCWRASALASPTDVPASTLPARGIAPVRVNIASKRVVLPLWKGPTSAMHRGPRGLLTSCPIRRLLEFGARPLIGSANVHALPDDLVWQAGKISLRCVVMERMLTQRHCEPTGRANAPDDRLSEAIHGPASDS